jgi:hypothetical protein
MASPTPQDYIIGTPKSLTFKGQDLGLVLGDVTISYSPEYADIMFEKYGTTVYDKTLLGEALTITVPMAEYTYQQFVTAMPTATGTAGEFQLGSLAGKSLRGQAGALALTTIKNKVYTFPVAVVHGETEITMNASDQTVIEVEFLCLPDTTENDGSFLATLDVSSPSV